MSFKKMIPLLFLIAFLILGSQYLVLISGTTEANSNVTAEYRGQFNTTRDVNITTISFVKFLAPTVGFVAIVVAVRMFRDKRR